MTEPLDNHNNQVEFPKQLDKPWFREAYRAAVKFHEKDRILDAKDRLELYNSYKQIAAAQSNIGWLGFSAVFLPPFALKYYQTKSFKGVRVPRNFVLGLFGMVITTYFAGNLAYKKQLQIRDPSGVLEMRFNSVQDEDDILELGDYQEVETHIKPRNERQYDMMKLLKYGASSRWARYFYKTYQHPDKAFPDPKEKLKELKNAKQPFSPFMNQRDPIGLHRKHEDKSELSKKGGDELISKSPNSTFWSENLNNNRNRSNNEEKGSSWTRIREESNFNTEERQGHGTSTNQNNDIYQQIEGRDDLFSTSVLESNNDQVYDIKRPTQQEFDELVAKERGDQD